MSTHILGAKLRAPHVPSWMVIRPRLRARLDAGLRAGRPVTLVSAPAGFGKTTCVSSWVGTVEDRAVAWLSLDPADDDPARFLAGVVAALGEASQPLAVATRDLVGPDAPSSPGDMAAALGNALDVAGRRCLLVLDDCMCSATPGP